jgi:cytochrome c
MKPKAKIIYLNIFIPLFLYALINLNNHFKNKTQLENHPPVVKIIAPKNNDIFEPGVQVKYTITVSDKEDGDSKFDEINIKEVLLQVRYFANKSKLPTTLNQTTQNDLPGIAVMRTSNCFNCHNFNGKSIGPSFYEISKRYPATPANTDTLVKHIHDGSSGTWGKEKMPTHPELTNEETKIAVQWILKHAADADVNYYIGTEGTFQIKPPVTPGQKGVCILTASYTDHGLKNAAGKQRLKGQDVVAIYDN